MSLERLYYRIISPDRKFYHAPVYWLLKVCSFFYRLGHRFRLFAYRWGVFPMRRLDCRVISVGNLTLGGTGKTPLVIMVAETLRGNGFKPAILSRGYGGSSRKEVNLVCDGKRVLLSADVVGDEPVMIANRLKNVPVLTGRDRRLIGQFAIDNLEVDTLILDDGFQHLSLCRDLDILLFDHRKPLGNGQLFPAGELREPYGESRRADLVCFTRCLPNGKTRIPGNLTLGNVPVVKTALRLDSLVRFDTGEVLEPEFIHGKPVAAFCGIARPDDFRRSLEQARARIVYFREFPDHHRYSAGELNAIEQEAKQAGAEFIVAPEKDAVKLTPSRFTLPALKALIDVEILEGRETFVRHILNGKKTTPVTLNGS